MAIIFNIKDLKQNIKTTNKDDFEEYLKDIYPLFEQYLSNLNKDKLKEIKDDLEDILYYLIDYNIINSDQNTPYLEAFLMLLAEQFENLYLRGAIIEIMDYIPPSPNKNRLEASLIYLKVNDITKEYHSNFDQVLSLISDKNSLDDKSINAVINYFLYTMKQFTRIKNNHLANTFKELFDLHKAKYPILQNNLLQDIIKSLDIKNHKNTAPTISYLKNLDTIQESYSIDIYSKLEKYKSIIEPILKIDKLKENIEKDPDYVIFKIRKVTEVITSKIYSKYDKNEYQISQNDKIRYLGYEKKILSRKAQSHLHTIRTIGNIGTHEHIDNPIEILKEDAFFLATALLLLIEDLVGDDIINYKRIINV